MKFRPKSDNPRDTGFKFKIGERTVQEVDSYCYLGIEIHKSGSFALARAELKKKAMRALYGLKGTVNRSRLSVRSLTTLFDSLIKPIALYGAPIYTPDMSILKHITKFAKDCPRINHSDFLRKLSQSNCEKIHLHFLKWALGVNKKASNAAVWGETGRYPLIYECINLTIKYLKRIKDLDDGSLVSLALKEQETMNLDWYRGIAPILAIDPSFMHDHVTAFNTKMGMQKTQNNTPNNKENFLIHNGFKKRYPPQSITPNHSGQFTPFIIMKSLKYKFRASWHSGLIGSNKLEFYRTIKHSFTKEAYLDHVKVYADRSNLTKLRISAHRLEIEVGRWRKILQAERTCLWCNNTLSTLTTENESNESHFINMIVAYMRLQVQDLTSTRKLEN